MPTLREQIITLVTSQPGLTDREITNSLRGRSENQQPINQAARQLEAEKMLKRTPRQDGLIGNYPSEGEASPGSLTQKPTKNHDVETLSEDEIKEVVDTWLRESGWDTEIAWGKARGIDIEARRGLERWVIEVKGPGSLQPMRVNYFMGILGETLQRMDDEKSKYSICLPDLAQYRGLWERLPAVAKHRTKISIIFVSKSGDIDLLEE